MNKQLSCAAVLAFALCALSGRSHAGVSIEFENRTSGKEKPDRTGTILVEKDRLRVQGEDQSVIFRADKQILWMIEEKKGVYREMTKDQMKKAGEQVSGAMAEMQKQLETLPPEQRKMVEELMAGKMAQGSKGDGEKKEEPRVFKKTGKTETINGFPCVSYDALRGAKREQEIWVADWKRFGLAPADFKAFEDLAAFVKALAGPFAKRFSTGLDEKFSDEDKGDALPGVPIRTITFHEGGDHITELKRVSHEAVPAARFEIPSGLKRESMGMDRD